MSSKPQHCVEVVPRIADIPAAAWDACANPDPAIFNPFIAHGFLEGAGGCGHGRRPFRLDAAPPRAQGRGRRRSSPARPAISSPTARASTCSTAPGPTPTSGPAGATIPSCRSPCRSRRCRGGGCWCGRVPTREANEALLAAAPPSSSSATTSRALHITFPSEGEWERLGARGFLQAHRPAVPLAQCRLRHLRRLPGLARLAQAQGGAQGARRGAGDGPRPSNGCAAATSPRRTGTRSSPSTWIRARASGDGPISTARRSR